ncbi:MAG: hypothetical protein H7X99_09050 [Saprospiraceae bacterium]|nr:hypothetical protein [Saprospiraceae bacterium]
MSLQLNKLMKENMKLSKVFISLLSIMTIACHSNKIGRQQNHFRSENIFFSIAEQCVFSISKNADSNTGEGICGELRFQYDYSIHPYEGPLTVEEDFIHGFRGNYYAKFFDIIHIDAKLHRLFMDSVSLISIKKKSSDVGLLFSCIPCTAIAKLSFRGRNYLYPFTSNPTLWIQNDYIIKSDTTNGYIRKIYIAAHDSLASGLYLYPQLNPRKNNKLSLTTRYSQDKQQLEKILKSVTMKNEVSLE